MSEQANLTDDENEVDVPFDDDNDFDADDDVEDDADEPVAFDAGETNRSAVTGPSSYAPHERMGRSRRIGSDVRMRDINYKNIPLLSRFLDARGRILSRRKTRVTAKVQRHIVKSIKHARHLALLPYTADQTRIVRKRR